MAGPATNSDKEFSKIVGRIFSDEKFAQGLESDPESTLKAAGYTLDSNQVKALSDSRTRAAAAGLGDAATANVSDAQVAAFVSPVVRVLTKGTKPVVNVAVSSVAVSALEAKERE